MYDRLALQDQAFGSSRIRDLAQRTSLQGSLRGRELVNSVVDEDRVMSMKTLWEGSEDLGAADCWNLGVVRFQHTDPDRCLPNSMEWKVDCKTSDLTQSSRE